MKRCWTSGCLSWSAEFHGSLDADLCMHYPIILFCYPGFANAYLSFSQLGEFEIFSGNTTDICCSKSSVIYLCWSNTFTIKEVLRTQADEDGRSYTASQTLCILYSLHHETYGAIHLGSHPPLWWFILLNSAVSSVWH